MAAKDLISRARAYQALQGVSGVDALLDTLITAVSDAIQKYCRRSFYARTLDEVHQGGSDFLLLREYPVQSITWLRGEPTVVLQVQNTATTTNQRATVAVTSTGLTLTRVASGVSSSDTSITFSGNATLDALATAIHGLGNGWAARVVAGYELWPSADLYVPPSRGDGLSSQGALGCAGREAGLLMHVVDLGDYTWTPSGYVRRVAGFFQEGVSAYRIKYVAGHTTIAEGLQEACAAWVAHLYRLADRDRTQISTSDGTNASAFLAPMSPPAEVERLLQPWRRHTV